MFTLTVAGLADKFSLNMTQQFAEVHAVPDPYAPSYFCVLVGIFDSSSATSARLSSLMFKYCVDIHHLPFFCIIKSRTSLDCDKFPYTRVASSMASILELSTNFNITEVQEEE